MSIEQLNNFITELNSLKDGQYIVRKTSADGIVSYGHADKKGVMRTSEIIRIARDALSTFQIEANKKNVSANATSIDSLYSGLEKHYYRVQESVQKRWWYPIAARFGYSYEGPKEIRDMLLARPLTLPTRIAFIANLRQANNNNEQEYLVRNPDGDFATVKKKPSFFKTTQILAVVKMCMEMKSADAKAADAEEQHKALLQLSPAVSKYQILRNISVSEKWGVWFASWFTDVNAKIEKDLNDALAATNKLFPAMQEQEQKNVRYSKGPSQ